MKEAVITIAIISVVTALVRFLPFWVFGEKRKTPRLISYLGTVLPFAIMGMLVVYCLKDIKLLEKPFGIPEAIACLSVATLHVWKRNTLLSVGVGTLVYMLLVKLVH